MSQLKESKTRALGSLKSKDLSAFVLLTIKEEDLGAVVYSTTEELAIMLTYLMNGLGRDLAIGLANDMMKMAEQLPSKSELRKDN